MKKFFLIVSIIISMFLIESCNRHADKVTPLGVKLYGKYKKNIKGNYVESKDGALIKQLNEGKKTIRKNLNRVDLTGYSLYNESAENIVEYYENKDKYAAHEKILDLEIKTMIEKIPIDVRVSYDMELRDGKYDNTNIEQETIYENYFPEPIITVEFSYAYIMNYGNFVLLNEDYNRLYLTKDGELVGEAGGWFMLKKGVSIKTRDEYAKKHLNLVQKLLGVEQTEIKHSDPYSFLLPKDYTQRTLNRDSTIGIKLYGKYKENIAKNYVLPVDEDLQCQINEDTKIIRKNIDKVDLTGYNLYYRNEEDIVEYYKKNDERLWIETQIRVGKELIDVGISYDAEVRDESKDGELEEKTVYENYFPEPIITVRFVTSKQYVSSANKLYFTKDGELVGEIGKWRDVVYEKPDIKIRNKYVKKYLNLVQELLGVEQTEIKYSEPYP